MMTVFITILIAVLLAVFFPRLWAVIAATVGLGLLFGAWQIGMLPAWLCVSIVAMGVWVGLDAAKKPQEAQS